MEIEFDHNKISFQKELTIYDTLALEFGEILQRNEIKYVFVSGYIAILFGRSRISEDIDVLVEKISFDRFLSLWESLQNRYYCHNTSSPKDAYDNYLDNNIAIRFSLKGIVIPNVEFKWASTEQQKEALESSLSVVLGGRALQISSLEIQIAFKLYLNSNKDIEDARYLFELFKDRLDMKALKIHIIELNIPLNDAQTKLGW
ncbi:MAG: hypothetical protein QGH39_00745 [Candidatus Thermoplasmatota archaeon]|jgi:hypothetical protein|nr:hypothetical protein [Candidatus Thermoplasmatota archaeon]MDP7264070.1 hypothetical protein [Candidatus Thermoplasmatota archaeon]